MSTLSVTLPESPLWSSSARHTTFAAACTRWYLGWLVVRTLGWVLVALTQPNPPLDMIEWLSWGKEWQLGYHKHPPLAAWLAELAYHLTPGSFLGIYLLGFLAAALALWSVHQLARRILPPRPALAAAFCLEGLIFLGPACAEFNNQVLLLGFWAWAIERFATSVQHDRWRDWVLTGLALGLAGLCKYTVVLLIVPLLAWWFWQHGLRKWTRPVLVAAVFLLVLSPHLVWLVGNDFPTLRYAARRGSSALPGRQFTIAGPYFLVSQLYRLIPVGLILWPMLRWRLRTAPGLDARDPSCLRSLVTVAFLGPVLLHLLIGLVPGGQLRDIWGMPLWTFAGLTALLWLQSRDCARAWRRTRLVGTLVAGCMVAIVLVGNFAGSALRTRSLKIHYPGRALSERVVQLYQSLHGQPPAIVAGDWWLAGNVACHSTRRPSLYASREPGSPWLDFSLVHDDWRKFCTPDPLTSPWTGDADLTARGGVLLWDATAYGEELPDWLAQRFPTATGQPVIEVPFHGGSPRLLRTGWATLAPMATASGQ